MKIEKTMIAAVALAATLAVGPARSQTTSNEFDQQQVLLAKIQADKAAVVLKALQLTDAEVAGFTPIYDDYQKDRKKIADRKLEVLNKFASNYQSMTDDAAKSILKEWIAIQEDETTLLKRYARRVSSVLPPTKALRFVQVENKLDTLLALEAVRAVPLAQ